MDDINFINKVVIVTGASSGIGAETAKKFAEYGGKLTLVGRNETRLHTVSQECEAKNGLSPLCLLLDLTHEGSCESVVNKTLAKYGKIDVLINCAGKLKVSSLFDDNMEVFDELMKINFRVPYHLSQLALPHLVKTKGNIVIVSFSMIKRYKSGFLPYLLSKSALQKFAKLAASELAFKGVRINVVSPGVTKTNIFRNLNLEDHEAVFKRIADMSPNGRIIEPKEVALLICLTASDLFPNMNGSNFVIDGAANMA